MGISLLYIVFSTGAGQGLRRQDSGKGAAREAERMESRQKAEGWLDPALKARISCHEIKWTSGSDFQYIQAGGDLYFHRVPQAGTMLHSHDFAEILLVTGGGLTHQVNGDRQHLETGSLCFLRPDDLHGFAPDAQAEPCEIVMLDFGLDVFLSLSVYLENDGFLQQLTAPVLPPRFRLDPASCGALYNRLLKLNNATIPPPLRKAQLKVLLGELFTRFFLDPANLLSESQVPGWLAQLCVAMGKPENFIAGVERMQKLACRTPGHLCKSFRKHLGKTPTDFVNELRINHAANLLADSQQDILEIADALNFQSLSRFYCLFRRQYGVSPGAYRRLHAGEKRL